MNVVFTAASQVSDGRFSTADETVWFRFVPFEISAFSLVQTGLTESLLIFSLP